jgi:hypothetical protein
LLPAGKKALEDLDDAFTDEGLPDILGLSIIGGPGPSIASQIGLTRTRMMRRCHSRSGAPDRGACRPSRSRRSTSARRPSRSLTKSSAASSRTGSGV